VGDLLRHAEAVNRVLRSRNVRPEGPGPEQPADEWFDCLAQAEAQVPPPPGPRRLPHRITRRHGGWGLQRTPDLHMGPNREPPPRPTDPGSFNIRIGRTFLAPPGAP